MVTNVNTLQGAGGATEQGQAGAYPRQGRGEREQGNVAEQREGCKRNAGKGSFGAVSEPSQGAQAAMCPISARRAGGGLFADKRKARQSDRSQMCLCRSEAQCPPLLCLFAAVTEASALPLLSGSLPLRSVAPCPLPPHGLANTSSVIVSTMPKPSEARRGFLSSPLG